MSGLFFQWYEGLVSNAWNLALVTIMSGIEATKHELWQVVSVFHIPLFCGQYFMRETQAFILAWLRPIFATSSFSVIPVKKLPGRSVVAANEALCIYSYCATHAIKSESVYA